MTMRQFMIGTFLLILIPFVSTGQGVMDGFMKREGHGDVALSLTEEYAPQYYAGPEKVDLTRNLVTASLYGVYGVFDQIDVIANVPFINGMLQDGTFLIRCSPGKINIGSFGNLRAIVGAGIRHPLSDYPTESALAIGQQATTILPKALVQLNLNSGWFLSIQSGYNYSLHPVPHTVPAGIKVGRAWKSFYADVWFDYQKALGGKDYRGKGDLAPETFRELGVSYQKVGGVFYKTFHPNWGGFIGGSYVLDGRNTPAAVTLSFGAVYKFDTSGEE